MVVAWSRTSSLGPAEIVSIVFKDVFKALFKDGDVA